MANKKKKKNSNYKNNAQTANTAQAQPKKKMIDGWMLLTGFFLGAGAIVIDRFIYDLPDWLEMSCLGVAVVLLLAYMSNARTGAQKK